jgi:hypothetical protein
VMREAGVEGVAVDDAGDVQVLGDAGLLVA